MGELQEEVSVGEEEGEKLQNGWEEGEAGADDDEEDGEEPGV